MVLQFGNHKVPGPCGLDGPGSRDGDRVAADHVAAETNGFDEERIGPRDDGKRDAPRVPRGPCHGHGFLAAIDADGTDIESGTATEHHLRIRRAEVGSAIRAHRKAERRIERVELSAHKGRPFGHIGCDLSPVSSRRAVAAVVIRPCAKVVGPERAVHDVIEVAVERPVVSGTGRNHLRKIGRNHEGGIRWLRQEVAIPWQEKNPSVVPVIELEIVPAPGRSRVVIAWSSQRIRREAAQPLVHIDGSRQGRSVGRSTEAERAAQIHNACIIIPVAGIPDQEIPAVRFFVRTADLTGGDGVDIVRLRQFQSFHSSLRGRWPVD